MSNSSSITKRYDFVIFFDCKNGNPNGDPDFDNRPRCDSLTGLGLVSDVCLKRKIRDCVCLLKEEDKHNQIFIRQGENLESKIIQTAEEIGIALDKKTSKKNKSKSEEKDDKKQKVSAEEGRQIREALLGKYYDLRTFGGVLTTLAGTGSSQLRGPVQMSMAESVEPIDIKRVSVARVCQASEEKEEEKGGNGTFGKKYITPYALYRCEGSISPEIAKRTNFSEDDLQLFWEAIKNMFINDMSASRGLMTVRKLIIFEHNSAWGTQPAELLEKVKVERIKPSEDIYASSYNDYSITVEDLPSSLSEKVKVTVLNLA